MSQIQKLDSLIVKIIKEELDEYTTFASNDGSYKGLSISDKILYARQVDAGNKPNIVKRGQAKAQLDKIASKQQGSMPSPIASENKEKEEEMQDTQLESMPTGTEIAGQVAEIVEKLKAMSEGSDDPKKRKLAEKIVKQMQSAKAALEALTAHEVMLEEKDQEKQTKAAEKHKKNIERIFKGIVKDENIVNRLTDRITIDDLVTIKKRLNTKGTDLDEDRFARIILDRSLKEGWVKKK